MNRTNRWLAPLLAGALVSPLASQELQLDVAGGSLPGELVMTAFPGLAPFELVLIVPSFSSGPTPVQLIDPNDFRVLSIGIDLLDLAWVAFTDFDGNGVVQVPLADVPAFQDIPLFFQAVTFQWLPTLLHRISNGNVIYLGTAQAFHERGVDFVDDRAFATVIGRPDRRTMICGGARGQLLAQVATLTTEVYDPMTDLFEPGPFMNRPRSMHTMTELPDGRYLFCGGVNGGNNPQSSCEVYDPVADTFTLVASMNSPRMGHTANLLANGTVLVTGGLDAVSVQPTQLEAIRDAVASTEIYDPVADSWTAGPNLTVPRAAHMSLPRPDGKILFAGGISWDPGGFPFGWTPRVRSSCDLYDPVTNTVGVGPSMAERRALTDAIEVEPGRWLLCGGMNGLSLLPFNPGNPTATAEIYNSASNSWTTVGSMATARANHRIWPLGNGEYLCAGGAMDSVLAPTPLGTTEIFSLATSSFTAGPAMTVPRAGAAMFLTPHGQVHLFGGASSSGAIVDSTEWYYF